MGARIRPEMTRKTLFLASPVRSGSTYIAEEIAYRLQRYGEFEFFDLTRDAFAGLTDSSTAAEIKEVYGKLFEDPRSGWSTTKIHCAGLSIITREARRDPELREAFFGANSRWIIVQRRNKIAQAVSLATARKSDVWHVYGDPESAGDQDVKVGVTEIQKALHAILFDDVYLDALSGMLAPERVIRVTYEDVFGGARKTTAAVAKLCELDVKLGKERHKQVAKIVPSARSVKSSLVEEFTNWLAENYHQV